MAALRGHPLALPIALGFWGLGMLKGIAVQHASVAGFWAIDIAYCVAAPLVVLYLLAKTPEGAGAALAIRFGESRYPGRPAKELVVGVLVAIGFVVAVPIIGGLIVSQQEALNAILPPAFSYRAISGKASHGLLVALYFALSAAVVEEWVYRSLPAQHFLLRERPRVFAYIAVSTLLFASAHWAVGLVNVLLSAAWGLMASAVVVRYRILWPVIVAHLLADFLLFS
jgi:hypothetical protein